MKHYILDEQDNPVESSSLEAWKWVEENRLRKVIGLTRLNRDVRVSTVFLTLDHGFGDSAAPIVFETMVFGGELDQEQERYTTYEDAIQGHLRWVDEARKI